jgi:hypothetical protein
MRVVLVVCFIALVLTSCTGPPVVEQAPDASAPSSVSSATTSGAARPVSLPCDGGAQKRVVGAQHRIVGAVFGRPLMAPPARDHANKILWVAEQLSARDLVVAASLNGTDLRVQRRVEGGPGPSIINVPRAGCWTFSLRWGDNHDAVAVRYSRSL